MDEKVTVKTLLLIGFQALLDAFPNCPDQAAQPSPVAPNGIADAGCAVKNTVMALTAGQAGAPGHRQPC